ncbi:MAG: hypothetical protein JWR52_1991 [Marmoricola sp.]|nr:hypothetical protein [Marmoricola sp.]
MANVRVMNPVTGLALGRIAIGVGALTSPSLATTLFRLDGPNNPQLPYMTRMFASREIAVGAITLASRGSARRNLVALGIAIDGADAFAGFDAMRSGAVNQRTGFGLVAPAIGAMIAGAIGLVSKG